VDDASLTFYVNNEEIYSGSTGRIQSGKVAGVFPLIWTADSCGDIPIKAVIDEENAIPELDDLNNDLTKTVHVDAKPKQNMASPTIMDDISFTHNLDDYEPNIVYSRGTTDIKACIRIDESTGSYDPSNQRLYVEYYCTGANANIIGKREVDQSCITYSSTDKIFTVTVNSLDENMPVGIYTLHAEIQYKGDDDEYYSYSEYDYSKSDWTFYVIFNYPGDKVEFVQSDQAYQLIKVHVVWTKTTWKNYKLNHYHPEIFTEAIGMINGMSTISDAGTILKQQAYNKITGDLNNCDWMDTLTLLKKLRGDCTDYSGLTLAYCRSVGIPSRMVTGRGSEWDGSKVGDIYGHAWVEIWNNGWYALDPAHNYEGASYKHHLVVSYGVEFRPFPEYYADAPVSYSPQSTIELFKDYTYVIDITNMHVTDDILTVTVKNNGNLGTTSLTPIYVTAGWGDVITRDIHILPHQKVADQISPGESKSVDFDVSERPLVNTFLATSWYGEHYPGTNWAKTDEETIFLNVHGMVNVLSTDNGRTSTDIEPTMIVCGDGNCTEFPISEAKVSVTSNTTEYNFEGSTFKLVETHSFNSYHAITHTLQNIDYHPHLYTLEIPFYVEGDAVHVPDYGNVTSDTTINTTTDYIAIYNAAQGTNGNVTTFVFSRDTRIKNVSFLDYYGRKLAKVLVVWNDDLRQGEFFQVKTYYQDKNGKGNSFHDNYRSFATTIIRGGDTLVSIDVDAPIDVKVGALSPINVTIQNNGIDSETVNVKVNMTQVMDYVPFTLTSLYSNLTTVAVSPQSDKFVTFPVSVPLSTSSGKWDIEVVTDKGLMARTSTMVGDAFDIGMQMGQNVTQCSNFTLLLNVSNTWNSTIDNVSAILNLFHSFNTTEPLIKTFGTFMPFESKTTTWDLNATSSGVLTIEVIIKSKDGGSDIASKTISVLSNPELAIGIHTPYLVSVGEYFQANVTIANNGDLPASNVTANLQLFGNLITTERLSKSCGDILAHSSKRVNWTLKAEKIGVHTILVNASDDAYHRVGAATVIGKNIGNYQIDIIIDGIGDDVYTPSRGYRSSRNVTLRDISTYEVIVQNEGNKTDNITLRFSSSSADWKVILLDNGTTVTLPYTLSLQPSSEQNLTLMMARINASFRDDAMVVITGISENDPSKKDVVVAYSVITASDNQFDTGPSTNPYPSINGTHKGTIRLNQTIEVQKLHTYSCADTNGHTEYARIWNATLNVTATWEGYERDWHNITFDNIFTLVAGETYNYSIRTGSYPQIHHTDNLTASNGYITCTEFIDANGKQNDTLWIPAIRLFP
jgi:hypothetical protein